MKFYSYDDIKNAANCREVAEQLLGLKLNREGRCAATWRGGDNPTAVSINEDGWYDHVKEEKGSAIDLVARVKFDGNVQRAQEMLGNFYSLAPKMSTQKRLPGEAPKNAYERLLDEGFVEKARYDYHDRDGELRHQVVRLEHPEPDKNGHKRKEFLQARPGDRWGVSGVELVLYNLPTVLTSTWMLIPEGEKDVDTLKALGLPATTNAGGAEKWLDTYDDVFEDRDVVILPDNDDKGRQHATVVASHAKKGGAKSIRTVTLSDLPKGDVTDWFEKEGGTTEKLREQMRQTPEMNPAEIVDPGDSGSLDVQRAKAANRYPFRNYILQEITLPNGATKKEPHPRKLNDLVDDCHERFLGFPCKVGESLFDHDRDNGRIVHIGKSSALFAWLQLKGEIVTDWKQGTNFVTKDEFLEGLRANAKRYEAIEVAPEFPTRRAFFYGHDRIEQGDPELLAQFLDAFSPASGVDRQLLFAFFASCFWGGTLGQRPAFLIRSDFGRGVGKTRIPLFAAHLLNQHLFSARLEEDSGDIKKRLLSPDADAQRIVCFDNCTGMLRNPEIAEIVTARRISGHRLYAGAGDRPNSLVYVFTLNGQACDSDLASRSVSIKLDKPKYDSSWEQNLWTFVDEHRRQLWGCFRDFFARTPAELEPHTRFPLWEREVLGRIEGADLTELQDEVKGRQAAVDTEAEERQAIVEAIKDRIARVGGDIENGHFFLSNADVTEVVSEAVGSHHKVHSASRKVREIVDAREESRLAVAKHGNYGKGFYWTGTKCEKTRTKAVQLSLFPGRVGRS